MRYKAFEPLLLLGKSRWGFLDIRLRVKGGGHVSQIYAIRQAIAKAVVAYYQKNVDESSKQQVRAGANSEQGEVAVAAAWGPAAWGLPCAPRRGKGGLVAQRLGDSGGLARRRAAERVAAAGTLCGRWSMRGEEGTASAAWAEEPGTPPATLRAALRLWPALFCAQLSRTP